MRLSEFGERVVAGFCAAPDCVVLRRERLCDLALVHAFVLGRMLLRKLGQILLQLTRLRQSLNRLAHILRVRLRVLPRLGRDQHPGCGAHDAVFIGAQLEPFTACILPPRIAGNARDAAQVQLRERVIAR